MAQLLTAWSDYGHFLNEQMLKVARYLPRDFFQGLHRHEALFELLFDKNAEFTPVLDSAVRSFIRIGSWPDLEMAERYFLSMRILCAMDTINIMLVGDQRKQIVADPTGNSREEILEWLLIFTWHEWRFDTWLKLSALRVHSSDDSFYGLGS